MKPTAASQQFPKGCLAFVEELPGASTQGKTLEEACGNLAEAVQLVLEANRHIAQDKFGQCEVCEVDGW